MSFFFSLERRLFRTAGILGRDLKALLVSRQSFFMSPTMTCVSATLMRLKAIPWSLYPDRACAWLCLRVHTRLELAYLVSRPKSSQRRRIDLLAQRYSPKVCGSRYGRTISVSCATREGATAAISLKISPRVATYATVVGFPPSSIRTGLGIASKS